MNEEITSLYIHIDLFSFLFTDGETEAQGDYMDNPKSLSA